MKKHAPVNMGSAENAARILRMHPRRLARQMARNEFTKNGWNMKNGYFRLGWRDAVRQILLRKRG